MRIVCPQCGYARDIPEEKIPARSTIANCPKCQFRFRFRESPEDLPESGLQPEPEPRLQPRMARPAVPDSSEPIYPPRPSRPVVPEPVPDTTPPPQRFDAFPAKSQARWLPDPEPETAPRETFRPSVPEPLPADPWSRLDQGTPDEPQPSPEPLARQEVSAPRAQARPDTPDGPDGPDAPPADDPPQAQAQPGLRDIWARLQSMDKDEPRPGGRQHEGETGQARPEAGLPQEALVPWERLERFGAVPAYTRTVKNILLNPGDFFEAVPAWTGLLRPLAFALITCELMLVFMLFWNFLGIPNLLDLGRTELLMGLGAGFMGRVAWLAMPPAILAAFLLLDAWLAHLLLGLLRGAAKGFSDTFRVMCYSGAPWTLAVLPVPNTYLIPLVLIWHMTMQAIGLKKLHASGYPQVLAAVLVKWSMFCLAGLALLHVLVTHR